MRHWEQRNTRYLIHIGNTELTNYIQSLNDGVLQETCTIWDFVYDQPFFPYMTKNNPFPNRFWKNVHKHCQLHFFNCSSKVTKMSHRHVKALTHTCLNSPVLWWNFQLCFPSNIIYFFNFTVKKKRKHLNNSHTYANSNHKF